MVVLVVVLVIHQQDKVLVLVLEIRQQPVRHKATMVALTALKVTATAVVVVLAQ
jgi:hypothetical protein